MMNIVTESSLSFAWARALKLSHEARGAELHNLYVTVDVSDKESVENRDIKALLESELQRQQLSSCETVAGTIFPWSLWNKHSPRSVLYERYTNILPRIVKHPANRRGIYFARMIDYPGAGDKSNQLEHVIEAWARKTHRHSALQIAIICPGKDHTFSRQQGFPCLQQISIDPYGSNGSDGFGLTCFYPTQNLFEKAYGNYLGLYRLGMFLEHELNLSFAQLHVVVAKARLNKNATKTTVSRLVDQLERHKTDDYA
jgi:hypothetical protein